MITLWDRPESADALEASPTYMETVGQITRTGFLIGDSSVEVFEVHGGDVSAVPGALQAEQAAG